MVAGSTPRGCYKKLVEFYKNGELSFKYVTTFNMDEYVGLPRDHPESYHSFMWENLFKHIDIDPANVHIPDGNAPDLVAECDAYERKIKDAGGIRLFLGGQQQTFIGSCMINYSSAPRYCVLLQLLFLCQNRNWS